MDGIPRRVPRRAAALAAALALATGACSTGSAESTGSADRTGGAGSADRASDAADRRVPTAAVTADERDAPTGIELVDVAAEVGLDFRHGAFRWDVTSEPAAMHGGGVCWFDYDGDGWLDLYAVNSHAAREADRWAGAGGLPRNALFHNEGFRNEGGMFVDVSEGSGADLAMQGNGCVAADLDLDGHTDLYVTGTSGGALLWNEGDGTFTEGAEAAGAPALGWYAGAAVGDVDGDGRPDLFVAGYANQGSPVEGATQGWPGSHTGVRDLLYLNEGPGEGEGDGDGARPTFREVGREAGLEVADVDHGLGAVFSDLDADGDLDLYVANDTRPNRLYDNVAWPGGADADPAGLGFRFEELAARAGAADPHAGMGVAAADYDADGWADLVVTNARGQGHAVFHGERPGAADPSFADVRDELGPDLAEYTGWGASWGDLDLDRDLDLVVANGAIPVTDLAGDDQPVQVLESSAAASGSPPFGGLAGAGPLNGRGTAAADYDNDGDLDVAVGTVGGRLALLENRGAAGNWLVVAPAGFHPGAVVTVALEGGEELRREVQAGSSYLSSEDPRMHVGLGDAVTARSVTVTWPGGEETTVADVPANQILVVEPPA